MKGRKRIDTVLMHRKLCGSVTELDKLQKVK